MYWDISLLDGNHLQLDKKKNVHVKIVGSNIISKLYVTMSYTNSKYIGKSISCTIYMVIASNDLTTVLTISTHTVKCNP